MSDLQPFISPAVIIASLAAMLRFFVVGKLNAIEESLRHLALQGNIHSERLTRVETIQALRGCSGGHCSPSDREVTRG